MNDIGLSETYEKHTEFYRKEFKDCGDNINEKWRFVNKILDRKQKSDAQNITIEIDGKDTADSTKVVEQFNKFFTVIWTNLSNQIPPSDIDFKTYLQKLPQEVPNFSFHAIGVTEVCDVIKRGEKITKTHI